MHTVNLPAFGAAIPGQGGRFVAIMAGHQLDSPPYALLVSDQAHEIERVIWGSYGKEIEGAGSRTDGAANTAAMLKSICPAAAQIAALEIDGHKDFFLPAIGQLNAAAANCPGLFDAKGVYWTSTQDSRLTAFVQVFEDGYSGWHVKGIDWRGRAFRQIPLDLLIA